ncbi:MAG: hypothetical protein GWP91_09390 [Rhodobacterales bacterium]|nr:hypothetical protein [Rhodobacterales bacterium]
MIALWLALALASPCVLDVPHDQSFQVMPPAERHSVHLILELWPTQAEHTSWALSVLDAVESQGQHVTLILPLPPPEGAEPWSLALAERAAAGGHEVGVQFVHQDLPVDTMASPRPFMQRMKTLRKAAGGVKLAVAPLPSRSTEALLGRLGFRTLLQSRGSATATPRLSAVFEGQPRIGAVLQTGPYAGACGTRPEVVSFTPAAADRVTQTLWGAARLDGVPVMRAAIQGQTEVGHDAEVVGRWIDEVLSPAGQGLSSGERSRADAVAYFRTGKTMEANALDTGGGRLVHIGVLKKVAESLADENILPRILPGDLNLSEAFLGFTLILAGQTEGEVVRLSALAGPELHSDSRLKGITAVEKSALIALATALVAELPKRVPANLPVGNQLLTATEVLTAMASVLREDQPPSTWPTAAPDPNAPGQGWGEATLP